MRLLRRIEKTVNSPRIALVVTGAALALCGALWEWIRFPVGPPVSGLDVGYTAPGFDALASFSAVPQGMVVILLILAASVTGGLGLDRLRQALAGLALAALFYHLIYLSCIEGRWIEIYMDQATAFRRQVDFLSGYVVPNSGEDNLEEYLQGFEHFFPDRLLFAWEAVGRGWLIAFCGAALLGIARRRRRTEGILPLSLGVAVPAGIILLLTFGGRALYADHLHYLGDRERARGAPGAALRQYSDALSADPMLGQSMSFMLKVSKSYLDLRSDDDPYAALYLAAEDLDRKLYDQAFFRLQTLQSPPLGDTAFRVPYLGAVARTVRNGYVARGLYHYQMGDRVAARADFQRALDSVVADGSHMLHAQFMLVKVDQDLRQYNACAERAERLLVSGQVVRKSTQADLYNTAGDCRAEMGSYNAARAAYFESYELDDRSNYRAYQGLSGS